MNSLGRASATIAAGTMISRVTGLLRTVVLVGVIGSVGSGAADAFGLANQLPNSVFSLISVGILTAVIVPQIVKASAQEDGGNAFISKLFTLGTVVLVTVTALATIAAPWLVRISAEAPPEQYALATAFAYWCLPQILFYGLYALLGETLNARRVYGPFTWAPVINNIVSIIGFLALGAVFGETKTSVHGWTPEMIAALGGTATLGIVMQAIVLLLFWRRTGLSLRPDFRWRGVGLGNVGKLAGWTLLMAIASLTAGTIQGRIAYIASADGASIATMQYAWLLYMLPYSIIVLAIGTPYFTQISEHAAAGRHADVLSDIGRSIRTLGFFLFAAIAAIVAACIPLSRVFTNTAADSVAAALVLLAYLIGLIPLMVLFIVQRTFYAYDDTRTPFWFTLFQCVLIIAGAFVALILLNTGVIEITALAVTIALSQSIASTIQTLTATWLLRRKIGGLRVKTWIPALGRFAAAAVPSGLAGWGVFVLLGGADGWTTSGVIAGVGGTAIIGIASLIVYLTLLAIMRAPELKVGADVLRKLIPGR